MAQPGGVAGDLDAWLAPFLDALGHRKRRIWAPLYLRGLLGAGERKSLQPMAAGLGLPGHDQLQHFIASPAWDDGPLWRVLADRADQLMGGPRAVLVIDDTVLPKKGELSVGVARQSCGSPGKPANCQVLISLTLAQGQAAVPVGLRLFLPPEWTRDPERCARAGVPEPFITPRSKADIALAELDRLRAAGLRFGIRAGGCRAWDGRRTAPGPRCAASALGGGHPGHPGSPPRHGPALLAAGVYGPPLQDPAAERGAAGGRSGAGRGQVAPRNLAAERRWRAGRALRGASRACGCRGDAGADVGPATRTSRHPPSKEVWLIGEWRSGDERTYYLSNLPPDTPKRALAAALQARRRLCRRTGNSNRSWASVTSRGGHGRACIGTH